MKRANVHQARWTPPAPTERELAWMDRNRKRRAAELLERKLAASRPGAKSIALPLAEARALLETVKPAD